MVYYKDLDSYGVAGKICFLSAMTVDALETIIHDDDRLYENNGYTLKRIFAGTKGHLGQAARSIASVEKPVVRILTGFFIEKANAAETDGPSSAAQLASFFKRVGIECCVTTDRHCEPVCRAALKAAECEECLEVVSDDHPETVAGLDHQWQEKGVTHVIAIERPSPNWRTKVPRNMKGEDIIRCAPLHTLLNDSTRVSIGIGDRGNECGMGNIGTAYLVEDIPHGEAIASCTGTDFLITARVSNWGANALLAALAVNGPDSWVEEGCKSLCPKFEKKILKDMAQQGAVDGITYENNSTAPTVDALPLDKHLNKTTRMLEAVKVFSKFKGMIIENGDSSEDIPEPSILSRRRGRLFAQEQAL